MKYKIIIAIICVVSIMLNFVLAFMYMDMKNLNYIAKKTATENIQKDADRKAIDEMDNIESSTISNYSYVPIGTYGEIKNKVERFMQMYYNYNQHTFKSRLIDISVLMTEKCYLSMIDGMDLDSDITFDYEIESSIENMNTIVTELQEDNAVCYSSAYIKGKVGNESTKTAILMEFILNHENSEWVISEIHAIGSNNIGE